MRFPSRNVASALITFLFAAGFATSAVPQGRTLEPSAAEAPFARSRVGTREIYIISFGLFGPQSVFASEAEKAAQILRQRLQPDAQLLVRFNHKRGGRATSASLAAALRSADQAMDPAKGILVVFLTSHGSPDGLEVVAGSRSETLSPRSFRSMLNASGARYRVVIISACYSGVFARALADPRTLVITAAAPDRPSFGCEDGATWTYFGDAFFNQALRASPTLDAAFCRAREIVTKRERREGFAPSKPQMAGGSEVLPLLGSPFWVASCTGTSAALRQHSLGRSEVQPAIWRLSRSERMSKIMFGRMLSDLTDRQVGDRTLRKQVRHKSQQVYQLVAAADALPIAKRPAQTPEETFRQERIKGFKF